MGRAGIAIVVAALAICGCGSRADDPAPSRSDDLAFRFALKSKPGFMDQVLEIENRGESGVAPVLALTPLDASGNAMPGVAVKTAYGSDDGRVVIPPRSAVVDILRFKGPRARNVEDVDVKVTATDGIPMDAPAGDLPVERLDHGRPVTTADFFDAYRVTNDTDAEARIRVVLIEWEDPPRGESQQALRVTPLSALVSLPANGAKTVRLPKALRGRVIGSVKAYYSR